MWKKLASIAATLSAAITVSSCQTAMYKPIICQPGTALREGKCQKVGERVPVDAPKAKVKKKPVAEGPAMQTPRRQQNVYGLPI